MKALFHLVLGHSCETTIHPSATKIKNNNCNTNVWEIAQNEKYHNRIYIKNRSYFTLGPAIIHIFCSVHHNRNTTTCCIMALGTYAILFKLNSC